MIGFKKYGNAISLIILAAGLFLTASSVFADLDGVESLKKRKIAVLESFSGEIVMKSRGLWGVVPKTGMDLYHGDKIVCKNGGSARVKFLDGAELEVRPNSTVRIAENIMVGGMDKQDEKRREMRLFIGKIKYKSGDNPAMKSVLIAPAAVAALRGSEAWFGTDGMHAYLDQIEGGNEIRGNISEGFVPEISADQAGSNSNYSAALKSDEAWRKYRQGVESAGVLQSNASGGSLMLADAGIAAADGTVANREIRNEQFIDLMGLLSEYALTHDKETENENASLLNHPDKIVADRAVRALNESKLALVKAQEAMNICLTLKQKAKKRLKNWDQYDANKRPAVKDILHIKQKTSEANELSAFVKMLSAEEYTIGLYEPGLKIEKLWPEIEKSAQQAIKRYEKASRLTDKVLNAPKWGAAEEAWMKSLNVYAADATANAAVAGAVVKTAESVMTGDAPAAKRFEDLIDETSNTRDEINELADQTDDIVYQVDQAEERPEQAAPDTGKLDDINNDAGRKVNTIPDVVFVPIAPEVRDQEREAEREAPPEEEGSVPAVQIPEIEPINVVNDRDGDGYPAGGRDCDDANSMINSGMDEICGDGVDNNCNGVVDETPCVQPGIIDRDKDGDGYPVGEQDCNDLDPTVHKGALEICGDGIDNNCNGVVDESPCEYAK